MEQGRQRRKHQGSKLETGARARRQAEKRLVRTGTDRWVGFHPRPGGPDGTSANRKLPLEAPTMSENADGAVKVG